MPTREQSVSGEMLERERASLEGKTEMQVRLPKSSWLVIVRGQCENGEEEDGEGVEQGKGGALSQRFKYPELRLTVYTETQLKLKGENTVVGAGVRR